MNDYATPPEAAEQPSFSSVVDGTNNFPDTLRKEHWPTAMSPEITGTGIPSGCLDLLSGDMRLSSVLYPEEQLSIKCMTTSVQPVHHQALLTQRPGVI